MSFTLQANYGGYAVTITGAGSNVLPSGIATKSLLLPTLITVSGLLTANTIITLPQGCGNLIIENDTTGAFALQINTPTQISPAPTISQGCRATLCSTPTDLVLAQTDTSLITETYSLAGATAGSINYSQPETGTAKRFMAVALAYENDTTTNQVITFPVPFIHPPIILGNSTGLTISATTTTLTITSPMLVTTYSGVIVVVGL